MKKRPKRNRDVRRAKSRRVVDKAPRDFAPDVDVVAEWVDQCSKEKIRVSPPPTWVEQKRPKKRGTKYKIENLEMVERIARLRMAVPRLTWREIAARVGWDPERFEDGFKDFVKTHRKLIEAARARLNPKEPIIVLFD